MDLDPGDGDRPLLERRDGAVAFLTLNRPHHLNALSGELLAALGERTAELAEDDGVRAIVITGDRRAFSVGADVNDFEALRTGAARRRYIEHSLWVLGLLADCSKPTVAAVDGLALGGGCELAMACDLVVAGPDAEFGLPEARLGVVPSFALTRGRRRLSAASLSRLTFTSERIAVAAAREIGLVDLIAETDALATATAVASEIAARPPLALRLAKALLRGEGDYAAAVETSIAALASAEHRAAVAKFRERRRDAG
jgi:enoyl-CoA hydratase/carnithine racemase